MNATIISSEPVYTLAVASRLSGIPSHSIRQYVDKGLILPYKTDTSRHLFSEVDLNRLQNIKNYIDEGLNIAGIKSLYALIPGFLINACSDKECPGCDAYNNKTAPCWITNSDKAKCNYKDCRSCEVYKMTNPIDDLHNYFLKIKEEGITSLK